MLARGRQPQTQCNCLTLSCCLKVTKSSRTNKQTKISEKLSGATKGEKWPTWLSTSVLFIAAWLWLMLACECLLWADRSRRGQTRLFATNAPNICCQRLVVMHAPWGEARTSRFLNAHSAGVPLNDRNLARRARKHFFSSCKWSASHAANCGEKWTNISRITWSALFQRSLNASSEILTLVSLRNATGGHLCVVSGTSGHAVWWIASENDRFPYFLEYLCHH